MKSPLTLGRQGAGILLILVSLTAPADTQVPLPSTMRFCGLVCFELSLAKGHYQAVADGKITSVWEVESFTPNSVIFHRTDANGATAVLRGSMAGDLSRVVNGEAEWLKPNRVRAPFQLS